jgi:prophage regulatory protein
VNTNTPQTQTPKIAIPDPSLPIPAELINAQAFAKMLSISERTLYRLKSTGELPKPVILGGSVRWRLEDIRRWISLGCPKP